MAEYRLDQLVDMAQVRELLESHHRLSGMAYGLLDTGGNVLVSAGWQEICVRFHNVNPASAARCIESNAYMQAHVCDDEGEYTECRCGNNMIDAALSLIIDGEHMATLFVGQFFYDDNPPDREFFRAQALTLGFDPDDYLAALEKVPLFSRQHVHDNLLFLRTMVNLLAETGRNNVRRIREMENRNVLLSVALNNTNDAVFLIEREQFRFIFVNDAACRSLGYSREELLTMTPPDINPDVTREMCMEMRENILAGLPVAFEARHRARDGRVFPVEISASLFEHDGALFCLSVARDITERKRMEQTLFAREQEFRALVENSPDLIFRYDRDCRRTYLNPAAERCLGALSSELLGLAPEETPVPWPSTFYEARIREVLESGEPAEFEFTLEYIRSGRRAHHDVRLVPEYDLSGQLCGVLAVGRDITARKDAEDILRLREQEYRSLAENSPDNILRFDRECRYIYCNPELVKTLSLDGSGASILGKTPLEAYPDGFHEGGFAEVVNFQASVQLVIHTGAMEEVELHCADPGGAARTHSLRIVPERDTEGVITGALAFGRDITDRKQAEEEHQANLRFLESMERVNRAIQGTYNLERMLNNVLGVTLSVFGCDRTYLMYPCDPDAETWEIRAECTAAEYPGARALGTAVSWDAEVSANLRRILSADGPVTMGPGASRMPSGTIAERFGAGSTMAMAVHTKIGKPWKLGIQQCSYDRAWTPGEERLLREIGRRLEDAMTSLLTIRDLRESEERYRRIVDTAAEGILMIAPEMLITFANRRMAEMLGYSVEEVIGRLTTVLFLFEEDVPDHLNRLDNRSLGKSESYECRLRHRDGRAIWAHASATPIVDAGKFNGFFVMFTDITERKLAELRVKQALDFSEGIINAIPDILFEVDREGRYLNVWTQNPVALAAQKEALLGKTVHDVLSPENAAAAMKAIGEADEKGLSYGNTICIVQQNGESRWFEHSLAKKRSTAPADDSFIVLSRDVTERKRMEEALAVREQEFRAMIENAPDPILRYDRDCRRIYVNPAAERITGKLASPIVGNGPEDGTYTSPAEAAKSVACIRQVLETGEGTECELEVMAHDSIRNFLCRYAPEWGRDGEVASVLLISHDITGRKRMETELQNKNSELERFTYTVSHDLKSPIITIKGFSGSIRNDLASGRHDRLEKDLARIEAAADRMAGLLNDLLELSRIGRIINTPEPVDMARLAHDVLNNLAGILKESNIQISVQPGLPTVMCDRQRMVEVMQNLIENAVKYRGNQPEPRIQVGLREEGDRRVFFVQDNGPGIDPKYHENIFGLFNRLNTQVPGTGIGLALVKRIIEVHGGRIWVESDGQGNGSMFCFTVG